MVLDSYYIRDIVVNVAFLLIIGTLYFSVRKDNSFKNIQEYKFFRVWLFLSNLQFIVNIFGDILIGYNLSLILTRIFYGLSILIKGICLLPFSLCVLELINAKHKLNKNLKKFFAYTFTILFDIESVIGLICFKDVSTVHDLKTINFLNISLLITLGIVSISLLVILITNAKYVSKYHFVCIFIYSLLPIAQRFVPRIEGINILLLTKVILIIVMYINIFMRRKEEIEHRDKIIETQQLELYDAKIQSMLAQIQPHFLYNTLNSIAYLCQHEPLQAKQLTIDFSNYLRGNLDNIKNNALIPFDKELEHTKIYLKIEKVRFNDILDIEYDINDTSFELPALTLQPIVENAVKHGICEKGEKGIVSIKTYDDDVNHYIEVNDTGIGFNVTNKLDSTVTHIGLSSVIERLKMQCNGIVLIDSALNVGTTVTMVIPKVN